MESKLARNRRLARRHRVLAAQNDEAPTPRYLPVSNLIAGAKLSDRQVRQIIRCYTEGKTPKEAAETSRVSQVTIRRMYRQIRERLIAVGLYEDRIVPGAPAWVLEKERQRHIAMMRESIYPHRGVKEANINAYYAEATYRRDTKFVPGQLYGLILKAIADLGPLNRKAKLAWPERYLLEYKRLIMSGCRARIRQGGPGSESRGLFLHLLDAFDDPYSKGDWAEADGGSGP